MQFKDKVVLITGGAGGIGSATAKLFAEQGAKVVINYFSSSEKANQLLKELEGIGAEAMAIKCDVSVETEVKEMINAIEQRFGMLDVVVNNAGVVVDVPLEERTVDMWKRTLDVNLLGTFLVSKYAAVLMLKNKKGAIVNISSTNGIDSFSPEAIDYDCSKAGIIIMGRNLAKTYAPFIRVNTIAPGWVDTAMNEQLPKDFIDEQKELIYMHRFANPAEIGKAILFFASEDASFITGSTLKIDGGYG